MKKATAIVLLAVMILGLLTACDSGKAILKITVEADGAEIPGTAKFVISGTPKASKKTFEDVTVTYEDFDDDTYKLEVPAGSYTVKEKEKSAQVEGFTLKIDGDNGEEKQLGKDATVTFELTNTYQNDYLGVYKLYTIVDMTIQEYADLFEVSVEEAEKIMTLELKSGGKAVFTSDGESETVDWKVDGEKLVLSAEGETLEGTIKDGIITLDFDGESIQLKK